MNRINYPMNGLAALAFIVLFPQYAGKADNQVATILTSVNTELSGMEIAHVEIDTPLAKHSLCIGLGEAMVKKSENVYMTLNRKVTALNKERQEFQERHGSSVSLSSERVQQEYNCLAKMEQDLQELSNKLQNDLMEDNNANNLLFRDSISAFLGEHNKACEYGLVFSNTGLDSLLYADSAHNITKEIVDGLNVRHSPAKK